VGKCVHAGGCSKAFGHADLVLTEGGLITTFMARIIETIWHCLLPVARSP
jgi:hypothetical protein